ncbi:MULTISPECIES: caspase family protein [unclassified Anabaena]|uniref:caspase family protein n=1 Tax=unclassified Anabaena TaxID=2619674 RepID=UPI0039C750DF
MAKNWALVIGINQYDFLQPLQYAKRDAQLMREFLYHEAGFDRIFFFSDDSPDFNERTTRPYRNNLLRVLRQLFENPFMEAGDNLWFFFSGHGMPHNGCDYLMPSDADPGDVENTAISINYITQRLRRCGADNVVLILDACRKGIGTRAGEGIGRQTSKQARQKGVISIFSCSPNEYSFEIEELQQGAFTYALLEALGIKGQCATVERLDQYISFRVHELVRQHKNAQQTPYVIAEPINKSHLILVPKYATLTDIAILKNDAYRAKDEGNIDLAEKLWIRVLAAAYGQDMESIKALQRIAQIRISQQVSASSDFAIQNNEILNRTPKSSSVVKKRGKFKPPTSIPSQSAINENIIQIFRTDEISDEIARDFHQENNINFTQIEPTREFFQAIFSSLGKRYGEQNWWIRDNKFQMCLEAILSQGTGWKNVSLAIENLKAEIALLPDVIYKMPEDQLRGLIRPCGRANTKVFYIKNFVIFLKEHYELNVEKMLAEETNVLRKKLLNIKGIGKFTCDNILLYTADRSKIPINDRMRKIFFEHDLINQSDSYDSVQNLVERTASFTPYEIREFDAMIYHVVKDYCHSTPKCEECPLQKFLHGQGPRTQRIQATVVL